MPSNKKRNIKSKAKSKARKAADAEERQDASTIGQMQQLQISSDSSEKSSPQGENSFDEDAFLKEAIELAAAETEQLLAEGKLPITRRSGNKCKHGMTPPTQFLDNFLKTFHGAFLASSDGKTGIGTSFIAAVSATEDEYANVWKDSDKIKCVISHLLGIATNRLLDGNVRGALLHASFTRYFEHWLAVMSNKTSPTPNLGKIAEMFEADQHTLVKFLRYRIPCKCLEDAYQQVKYITKMGLCTNPDCPLPDQKLERSALKTCDRCRMAYYCSRKCRKANWELHRSWCEKVAKDKARFEETRVSV